MPRLALLRRPRRAAAKLTASATLAGRRGSAFFGIGPTPRSRQLGVFLLLLHAPTKGERGSR